MTPHEAVLWVKGYNQRMRENQEVLAWHAAHIMNMWTKQRIRPKDLLGGGGSTVSADMFNSPEELRAYLEKHKGDQDDELRNAISKA